MNHKLLLTGAALAVLALLPTAAQARIPEPDHVFYGRATANGTPLLAGMVTVVTGTNVAPIASFALTPAANGYYVLRVPIDSVDPQDPGTARPGDDARFFIDGDLAGAEVVGDRGTATALDLESSFDDSLTLGDALVLEGTGANSTAVFTVTLGSPTTRDVTVAFATADGTAVGGADYQPLSGVLTFTPGVTTQSVSITVIGDALNEIDESFGLNLSSPSRAVIADGAGVAVISNDDPLPRLTIDDITVAEGASGTVNATFTVALSEPSGQTVKIDFATGDGTATPDTDYTPSSGTLVFPPLTTQQPVQVRVIGDATLEDTESFFVNLSGAVNNVLSRARGQGWIIDNSPGQRLQFSAAAYSTTEAGTKATIYVKRSAPAVGTVNVSYEATDGTAVGGQDYTPVTGTLTFGPNVLTQAFAVPISNDTIQEGAETVLLRIFNPLGGAAVGAVDTAVLTIADNDLGGKIYFSTAQYAVSEAGPVATITLKRSGGAASGVTVDWDVTDGTATAGQDYAASSGTVSFGANALTQTFTIPVLSDSLSEGDETALVNIHGPTGGAVLGPSQATLNIIEDEPVLQLSAATYPGKEGSAAQILVKRSGPVTSAVTVDYQATDGSAIGGADYTPVAGTMSLGAGVRSKTFAVPILNDTEAEPAEAVLVSLSNPTGGVFLGQQDTAVVIITDNDIGGTLEFSSSAYITKETLPSAVITVKRSGGTAGGVTVDYATSDGTGSAGVNYTATSGTLSFGPGIATRTFSIPVLNDGIAAPDVTVNLALSNPTGGGGLGPVAGSLLTIQSGDPLLQWSAAAYTAIETGGKVVLTIKRSGPSTGTVGVDFMTTDGSATGGLDYTASSGTVSFGPGVLSKTISVPVLADAEVEGDETFSVNLLNATGGSAVGVRDVAAVTILTASPRMVFSLPTFTTTETATKATISVKRLPPTNLGVGVDYATSNGTAIAGLDYDASSGTLSFAPGVGIRSFVVPIRNDTLHEPGEFVNLTLSNPAGGAFIGTQGTAVLNIASNDAAGTLQFSVAHYSVSEKGPLATITVTRSGGTASGVTVDYSTSDGTGQAGVNYTPVSGTLIFGDSELSKTFTIPILDDLAPSGNLSIDLALSNPTGGGVIGRGTATLWVVDNQ